MRKTILAVVATMAVSASAFGNDMFIDVGTNTYDTGRLNSGLADANTTTGIFNEFGFSQLLATSIYDFTDASVFGSFFDTNRPALLAAAGIPAIGTALDGVTPVSLVAPSCGAGQCDIDALSPLVPPLSSDNEGFLQTWDLQVDYLFNGTLTAAGPVYTSGDFRVFFNDLNNNANDRLVLQGTLTGSNIQLANLNLFFDITFAELGFLFVDDGTGTFVDAALNPVQLVLDTNVNPPIPTANQLLLVGDNVIRQTTLDGSITALTVPEPATLALLGLSLLGLGATRRRKA